MSVNIPYIDKVLKLSISFVDTLYSVDILDFTNTQKIDRKVRFFSWLKITSSTYDQRPLLVRANLVSWTNQILVPLKIVLQWAK